MTPIPTRFSKSADATASVLHRLTRRGEEGRIAGMLVGCLIGGIAAVALVYFCFNCAFAPNPRKKTVQPAHFHVHKAHPHLHHIPSHAPPMTQSHTHAPTDRHPHVHRWTHHHHKHAHHHHHHSCKAKPRRKQCPKAKRRAKPQPARRDRRPPQDRGPAIRFMPMPPMTAMPMPPAPVVGMGMDGGADIPLGDDFVDYGPAPDQGFGLEMAWDMNPNFRLEEFAMERDAQDDGDSTCNECCYSFFDAICGVPKGGRDLRWEAAGHGEVVLEDNEMAAV
ncbi:hypothetical protein LY78DRAFT_281225 [Colletotrichum sublineola]|nr:hypothetical protein LY78DRAFT_281225 [Colletotrichum sublineola]